MRLVAVTPEVRPVLLGLRPAPAQEPFSGRAEQTLPAAEADDRRHPVVMLDNGEAVGFFVLDQTPSPADPDADLVLRAFFVDERHQRQGHARTALSLLPAYALRTFPSVRTLVLTVNVRNTVAYRVYVAGGFVDGGERYLGGGHGPQHVLRLMLAPR